ANRIYPGKANGQSGDDRRCKECSSAARRCFCDLLGSFWHQGRAGLRGAGVMSNKMWGGRFTSGPDKVMEEINASIDFDRHLYAQDIAASKAHAQMLAKQGIIAADDAQKIAHGLDTILSEIEGGSFSFKRALQENPMKFEAPRSR